MTARPDRPGGPPPLVPAIAYAVLMVASVAVSSSGPRTATSAAKALTYLRDHSGQERATALLGFAAALPLAIWAAVIYRRLRTAGVIAPGPIIGLVGGMLAAASLALSGLLSATMAETAKSADPAVAHALVDLSFATGAAGFVVPLGLLVAGVAVPALFFRLLHPVLSWIGLVIAVVAVLSTFTLLTSALDFTLPIGRFGGTLWIIAASATLAAERRS